MTEPSGTREALIRAAADLFRRQGYAATGLNEILQVSGAPKGSLYYHFPGGKSELGAAAVRHAGALVAGTLSQLAAEAHDVADLVARYATALAGWMESSSYRQGNPIATTVLEQVPADAALTQAADEVYAAWTALLAERLRADGVPADRSPRLARSILAALDGALIQARVEQRPQPIIDAADELRLSIEAARPPSR